MRPSRRIAAYVVALTSGALLIGGPAHAAGDTVDEIHYEYGSDAGTVVLAWHGDAASVDYGETTDYGRQATPVVAPITPVDTAGPFERATLTGLVAGVTYHYRIGPDGTDHTLRAAPDGSFTSVDIGDTSTTRCAPWMAAQQQLVAAQSPDFVTHGGDISYANECGAPAVHQLFQDVMAWSTSAAFQPAWGNHEYGPPDADAPSGTPRDSMSNYKGRIPLTNAQTLPGADSASKRSNPGCDGPLPGNNCEGDDWGWFRAGGVLYISYPEPWYQAYSDWQPAAAALMAAAQADPTVDFVVTYGHRPAWSSLASGVNTDLRAALVALSAAYPKYILNIGHHVHAAEVFAPSGRLTEINDGGGGAGQTTFGTPAPNSILRVLHPSVMRSDYDATAHTLRVTILCGAVYTPNPKDACVYGSTLYSYTWSTAGGAPPPPPPPPPPPVTREWVTNPSVESDLSEWTGTWGTSPYVTVRRDAADAHTGAWSVLVSAGTGAANLSSGFSDAQSTVRSAVAGTTYHGSVWVRAQATGQVITLRLREWNGSTLVTDSKTQWRATDTAWHRVAGDITAARSGTRLAFAVYADGLSAGSSFRADDMSLTS